MVADTDPFGLARVGVRVARDIARTSAGRTYLLDLARTSTGSRYAASPSVAKAGSRLQGDLWRTAASTGAVLGPGDAHLLVAGGAVLAMLCGLLAVTAIVVAASQLDFDSLDEISDVAGLVDSPATELVDTATLADLDRAIEPIVGEAHRLAAPGGGLDDQTAAQVRHLLDQLRGEEQAPAGANPVVLRTYLSSLIVVIGDHYAQPGGVFDRLADPEDETERTERAVSAGTVEAVRDSIKAIGDLSAATTDDEAVAAGRLAAEHLVDAYAAADILPDQPHVNVRTKAFEVVRYQVSRAAGLGGAAAVVGTTMVGGGAAAATVLPVFGVSPSAIPIATIASGVSAVIAFFFSPRRKHPSPDQPS